MEDFCAITGADAETARFYLESSGGNVEAAVASFFDNAEGGAAAATPAPEPAAAAPTPAAPTGSGGSSRRRGGGGGRGNVRGFADMREGEDSDEEGKPREFFTGGEKSGMMVQDPTQGEDRVQNIFDKARAAGAEDGRPEDLLPEGASGSAGTRAFSGTGRTLAGGEPAAAAPTPQEPAAEGPPEPLKYVITFWRNGFTVNDGPLRTLDDPANASFLESIQRGECPRELAPPTPDTPIHVNLMRKDEDWSAPPTPKYVAFSGSGRTLGGTSSAPAAPAAAPPPAPSGEWTVDESQPTTSVQLRLSDGSRVVAKFNLTHTVQDILRFIATVRPGMAVSTLQLAGFPPKQLNDMAKTISEEGLQNAVVIVR